MQVGIAKSPATCNLREGAGRRDSGRASCQNPDICFYCNTEQTHRILRHVSAAEGRAGAGAEPEPSSAPRTEGQGQERSLQLLNKYVNNLCVGHRWKALVFLSVVFLPSWFLAHCVLWPSTRCFADTVSSKSFPNPRVASWLVPRCTKNGPWTEAFCHRQPMLLKCAPDCA